MAAELFINLDDLDLDQVALTRQDIDLLIPQAGDMRQIDHVVWIDEEKTLCVSVKNVREDEFWIPGHIPGRPLMPGVLMIEAAAQTSAVLYRLRSENEQFIGFVRCDNVAFRGQVVPGSVLHFVSKEIEFKRRRFITLNQAILNGKLIFEGRIMGMQV